MSKKNDKTKTKVEEIKEEPLNIPDDEIWTYRIEGLQAPRIVDKTVSLKSKIIIIVVLLVAIVLSIYFSIRAVSNDEFDYKEVESGIELVKYSNVDGVKELTVDYMDGDKSKPITELHEYAFNCDEVIETIYLGKDIQLIDGKTFYSCWNLQNVFVDDDNPYYCDIDGVLYDKELTQVIYYPSAHNIYLAKQAGYDYTLPKDGSITDDDFTSAVKLLNTCVINGTDINTLEGDNKTLLDKLTTLTGVTDYSKFIKNYNNKVGYYVIPSTVTKIGKLSFAYSDIFAVYIPEGVTEMETMSFFKAEKLAEVYSYTADEIVNDTVYENVGSKIKTYKSLPEGLEIIGSDCFTYDREINYMYIPASVTKIGHHAFFNMCYKEDGNIVGLAEMNVALSEDEFKNNTSTGDSWLPTYDSGLFEKKIDVNYSSPRE